MSIYNGLILFCIWSTVGLSAGFALLIVRRWISQKRIPLQKARQVAITRSYLQRVGGFSHQSGGAGWPTAERLQAIGHLLLLLRGAERDRLIQLVEIDGLLVAALRKCKAWRAARRIDAIRNLQQFGGDAAVAALRDVLRTDRHRIVRLNAAFALASFGRLPPPRETIELIGMPSRTPTRLDVAMMRAMAPDYADQLVRMLSDGMPLARHAAIVDALGWSADHAVLPALMRASTSDDIEIRCAALRAVAKLGHPAAGPWVQAALGDSNANVRIQAVNSCAALRLVDAVPMLRQMCSDPELWVRLRAEEALAQLVPLAGFAKTGSDPASPGLRSAV